ncbi:DUF1573 domain-containing protein [Vibrio campbellii]|uniref:DUF1573 domain-containing protein n=1 Tax=Vibrio campbellii TaxID=680 RepID=UPI0005EE6CDB|nr:DUF1573 domain-containing protein [Vibrio campbellii]
MTKELIPLITSVIALVISLYNLYIGNFRRKDSLTCSLLSCGISETEWDTLYEYSLSNTGDNQLVIKEVELLAGSTIVTSQTPQIPVVLKPGEIVLVDVLFNKKDLNENECGYEMIEFGVVSSTGKAYRVPHAHKADGKNNKDIWEAFKLDQSHEGF